MYDKQRWLEIADSLKPELNNERVETSTALPSKPLTEGNSLVLDFGNHHVGYFSMRLKSVGSHPDAPAFLKIKFCENQRELDEDAANYQGWISRGWIQEEQIHVDILPEVISLARRYAFRYAKIEVLAVSSKYQLVVEDAWVQAVTSARDEVILPLVGSALEEKIDAVAIRTLRNCMQDVFEDGPKRDRRLWIGDLRLQALANYVTYQNNDLVKRCLYLFAGTAGEDNRIAACVFTEPNNRADDTYMLDYSLFFIPTLLDYYEATGDMVTLADLAPIAIEQLKLCSVYFDNNHLVRDSSQLGWCFVDWNLNLNKQASAQAIYIYCAKAAEKIAHILKQPQMAQEIQYDWQLKQKAAMKHLYDKKRQLFVSGAERQISVASQIWFVLSGILDQTQAAELLERVMSTPDAQGMVTPYMLHHYVQALRQVDRFEKAHEVMMNYWGGMINQNADTFFELFNPDNPLESPYGSSIVNSYCHAWSCTPTWFLRKVTPALEKPIDAILPNTNKQEMPLAL